MFFSRLLNFKNKTLFVTGTDTNVGKTFISSLIAKELGMNYWKPFQTGIECGDDDTKFVSNAGVNVFQPVYKLKKPLCPLAASWEENVNVNFEKVLAQSPKKENLLIEGAGGLFVPVCEGKTVLDLIIALQVPVIIVAADKLGTINHTLLTIEALQKRNIQIAGIVMNFYNSESKNAQIIEQFGGVEIIAKVLYVGEKI
ncbi:MAG: dethiobiotin synthase [Pseudomonadota bacterium]|jgi:dethiobiotin synthetase